MDMQINSVGQSGSADVARQTRSEVPVADHSVAAPVVAQAKSVPPVSSATMQEQVKSAVDKLNQVVQSMPHGSNVEFTVDKETNSNVIKVIDKVTDEVIRQFPSEEVLSIVKALDKLHGMLIREKA